MTKSNDGAGHIVPSEVSDRVDAILSERGNSHGDFNKVMALAHRLRQTLRESDHHHHLPDAAAATLDEMCLKIARIVEGNPFFAEHWDDVEGYARLVKQRVLKAA